jgi:hypothetical protein
MPIKIRITIWSNIFVLFAMLFLAGGYILLATGVNTSRIDDLRRIQEQIQQKVDEIVRGQAPSTIQPLQQEMSALYAERKRETDLIEYGDFTKLSFLECFLPLNPACFHRNSSETNNLWIAIASGALGAVLLLLREIRTAIASTVPGGQNVISLASALCLLLIGMIMGMLTLFLLRGTKGTPLGPITDIVQIESPYGIAFASTVAAMFSDRIIGWLSNVMDIIPSKQA